MRISKLKPIVLFIIFAVAFAAALTLIFRSGTLTKADTPVLTDGMQLKEGKYYVDGNTDSYYIEVLNSHQFKLCGIEPEEYAKKLIEPVGTSEEETDAYNIALKNEAEFWSEVNEYKTFHSNLTGADNMFYEWEVNEDGTGYGTGFRIIEDGRVLYQSEDEKFILVE